MERARGPGGHCWDGGGDAGPGPGRGIEGPGVVQRIGGAATSAYDKEAAYDDGSVMGAWTGTLDGRALHSASSTKTNSIQGARDVCVSDASKEEDLIGLARAAEERCSVVRQWERGKGQQGPVLACRVECEGVRETTTVCIDATVEKQGVRDGTESCVGSRAGKGARGRDLGPIAKNEVECMQCA